MRPQSLTSSAIACPQSWSKSHAKRLRYAQESYFIETYIELTQIAVGNIDDAPRDKTFILFKPDAAAARSVEAAILILAGYSLQPIYATPIIFDRLLFRELWCYELNASTYERFPAVDALLRYCPSLFVLLKSTEPQSAASFLSELKGPSKTALRRANHLRTRMGAGDGVLNNIHTPEETADFIREIGVLFDTPSRATILRHIVADSIQCIDITTDIETFYEGSPKHHLSAETIHQQFFPKLHRNEFEELLLHFGKSSEFSMVSKNLFDKYPTMTWWDAMVIFVTRREFATRDVVPILEFEDEQFS